MKIFRLFLCALLMLALAARVNALTLFGATAGAGPGELYTINPADGSVLTDIGPLNDAGVTPANYNMTGLAFDPVSGLLYGSTGASGANPAERKALLVTINPTTAIVTVIGAFNATTGTNSANTMTDLAVDPTSSKLYGIGSTGGAHLYEVNKTTGQATLVGTSQFAFTTGGGVAVTPTGIVYGAPDGADFGTYDKTTGAFTFIANPEPEPLVNSGYGSLSFDGASVLYGVNVFQGSSHLVTIDLATAAVTDLGSSVSRLDAIAFQPVTTLSPDYNGNGKVDAADYVVWRKDPASHGGNPNGYTAWRAAFGNSAGSGSGANASSVPEPASLVLILAGMLGGCWYRFTTKSPRRSSALRP